MVGFILVVMSSIVIVIILTVLRKAVISLMNIRIKMFLTICNTAIFLRIFFLVISPRSYCIRFSLYSLIFNILLLDIIRIKIILRLLSREIIIIIEIIILIRDVVRHIGGIA